MKKILIVDDNVQLRNMYSHVLVGRGYDVIYAGDGIEAVEVATAQLPDLMLMDVMMPKLSGVKVVEKLKANSVTKNIPIVMFTNLAREEDAKYVKSLGVLKYLIKSDNDPMQIASLVESIVGK